ncbi:hypothetical protein FACS1894189_1470 [Planctomycetales bacterium]|nr:hypothetical protein FACS1894189_1470 [Planctomycetales bacterium]
MMISSRFFTLPFSLYFVGLLMLDMTPCLFAEISGADVFIKACELTGTNPTLITSGRIDFSEKVFESRWGVPEEYSQQETDRMLNDVYEGNRERMEKSLRLHEEDHRRWFEQGRHFKRNKIFLRKGTEDTLYRVVSSLLEANGEYEINYRGLQKKNGASSFEHVSWMFDSSLTVGNTEVTKTEAYKWGRIQGWYADISVISLLGKSDPDRHKFPAADIAQFKRVAAFNPEAFILTGEAKYDNNAVAKIIDVKVKGNLLQRYWIDPSCGYICPLVQIYNDKTWNLIEEYKSSDYFLDERSGLWFPERYIRRTCNPQDGKDWTRKEYTVNRESFALNVPISENEFAFDIPEGVYVGDTRGKTQKNYRAVDKGVLSLAKGGLDLDNKDWLVPMGESAINRAAPNPSRSIAPTIVTSIGIIFILLGVYRWWKRRPLLIFLCLLPLVNGCGKSPVDVTKNPVTITPAVLDFGQARYADSPIKIPFTVTNNSKEPISIEKIYSGCGCTVTEIDKTPILPGTFREGQVKVDIHGRKGDFANRLFIAFQEGTRVEADITGKIVNDIWFPGQSLRQTAKVGQENVSVTFTLHTIDHTDVVLKLKDADDAYTLKEEYRHKEGEETFIAYTLDVAVRNEDFISTLLTLEDEKSVVAPVTIPFYCYREKENAAPGISTARIGLGSLPRNAKKEVKIFGDCDVLSVIREATLRNVPEGVGIELTKNENEQTDFLTVVIFIGEHISLGSFEGSVSLKTLGNREYLVPLDGEVRND